MRDIMSIIKLVRIIEENKSIGECMFCDTLAYYQIGNIVTCEEHIHTAIRLFYDK